MENQESKSVAEETQEVVMTLKGWRVCAVCGRSMDAVVTHWGKDVPAVMGEVVQHTFIPLPDARMAPVRGEYTPGDLAAITQVAINLGFEISFKEDDGEPVATLYNKDGQMVDDRYGRTVEIAGLKLLLRYVEGH